MLILKKIITITFSLVMGFGLWFGIFWIFIIDPNIFAWTTLQKVFYVVLSIISTESIMKIMGVEKNDIV